jgi:hypothetical protein
VLGLSLSRGEQVAGGVCVIPASAVLVTRGDVDLEPVLATLRPVFEDIVVWNNAERDDLKCFGRFVGASEARHDLIYVQDDDLLVPVEALYGEYVSPGIVANRKPDEGWRFVGAGAFFDRRLIPAAFGPYLAAYPRDDDFLRAADVVFAYANPYTSVWVGYEDLPWQTAENRMYRQPGHYEVRERARARTLAL